jgi:hypothetical protein
VLVQHTLHQAVAADAVAIRTNALIATFGCTCA